MVENERNQQQQPGNSTEQTQKGKQGGQSQNTEGRRNEDQNPQGGEHWNNYRTRELSDDDTGESDASTPERE